MQNILRALVLISMVMLSVPNVGQAMSHDRRDSIREARVWLAPSWIRREMKPAQKPEMKPEMKPAQTRAQKKDSTGEFIFDSRLDLEQGPSIDAEDRVLAQPTVLCEVNSSTLAVDLGGMTMKFYCELRRETASVFGHQVPPALSRSADIVKIKYKFDDGEVAGEILGTRLLWALGFASDHMFMIEKLNCFGCTADPFRERRVDRKTQVHPREFSMVATERKFPGKEIKWNEAQQSSEGWTFEEMMNLLPNANLQEARAQREALRLMAVFLRHADNKAENQSLVCDGKTDKRGGCQGQTTLMLHDLGATFGNGFAGEAVSKANFEDWDAAPIWSEPETCRALLGPNAEGDMEEPMIREEGRVFLAKLLRGFVAGKAGRKRVEDLFRSGHAELRMGTIQQWTKTFYRKVDEIEFPMGEARHDFECPRF